MTVKENLKTIKKEIDAACQRSGRSPEDVHIIAVTKYVSEERTLEALNAGVLHIGENRVEGGVEKKVAIGDRGTWHFIGSLQSKKVKKMIDHFDYLHSLDRYSLAEEIDKRSNQKKILNCFVQVNISGEETKSGLSKEQVIPFIQSLNDFHSIKIVGLMTMAPFYDDSERTRPIFRSLRELKEEVQALKLPFAPCTELSMGMSNDYIVAVEEGATFVRIGSSLVGNEKG